MAISEEKQVQLIRNDLELNLIPEYGLLFTSSSPFELKKIGKTLLETLPKTVVLAIQNLDNLLAFATNDKTLFTKLIHSKNATDKDYIAFDIYPIMLSERQYSASIFYIRNMGFYCQLVPFSLYAVNDVKVDVEGQLAKLSAKEAEVFKNYSLGKKRSQTAKEMAISVHTYDNHLQSIRRKLTQTERQELLIALQQKNDVIG